MSFDSALSFVLGFEGGYSNDPRDHGGATNLGITQRTLDQARLAHPGWNLPTDVRSLTRAQAARIYRADYWDAVRGDDLPPGVALLVFDCAVNQGPARARKWLQEAADVTVDGIMGPKTMEAIEEASVCTLIREFALIRAMGYITTGQILTFGKGWFRRLFGAVIEAVKLR
jgi:lysozyme family protein